VVERGVTNKKTEKEESRVFASTYSEKPIPMLSLPRFGSPFPAALVLKVSFQSLSLFSITGSRPFSLYG